MVRKFQVGDKARILPPPSHWAGSWYPGCRVGRVITVKGYARDGTHGYYWSGSNGKGLGAMRFRSDSLVAVSAPKLSGGLRVGAGRKSKSLDLQEVGQKSGGRVITRQRF